MSDTKKLGVLDLVIISCVILLSSVYLFYFLRIFVGNQYLPPRSDPTSYFMHAKAFYENNLFQSVILDEYQAPILGADVHGPMYPFFQGSFAKIFGFHDLNFIYLNLFFLIAIFVLIIASEFLSLRQKGLILIINLAYFISFWSSFTFTPEIYHIAFANFVAIALIKIHRKYQEKTLEGKDIYFFLGMILLFASFRYSWTLSAVAIIPFATNRKQLVKYSCLAAFSVLLGFAYLKLFHAPYYDLRLTEASILIKEKKDFLGALMIIVKNVISNLQWYFYKYYFSFYYYLTKIIFVVLMVFHAYKSIRDKDRLNMSALSLALMYFLSLLLFFDAFDFRDIRGLSCSLIILAVVLVYQNCQKLSMTVALLFVLCFPFTFQGFHYFVYDMSVESARIFGKRDLSGFQRLPSNGKKQITVLIRPQIYWELMEGRQLHIKNILHTAALTLPLKNYEGVPMQYTYNNDTQPPYAMFNRIKVDYVHVMETGQIRRISR